jgi:hypothetical protein
MIYWPYLTRSFVMSQDIGITHPAAVPTPETIENQIMGTKYETSPGITNHKFTTHDFDCKEYSSKHTVI